jgi:hypothetical protein
MTEEPTAPSVEEPDAPRLPHDRPGSAIGDVLPETTSDERDLEPDPARGDADRDEWLRREVPPHH